MVAVGPAAWAEAWSAPDGQVRSPACSAFMEDLRLPSNSSWSTEGQLQALAGLIERAHSVAPPRLLSVVRQAAAGFGAHVELRLVDFGQTHLVALVEDGSNSGGRPVPVSGSLGGRAFLHAAPVSTPLPGGGVLITAPLLDGIERLGVLELSFASGDLESTMPEARRFTELVTQFLATKSRVTDEFHRVRCLEPMTLAAQMQWQGYRLRRPATS